MNKILKFNVLIIILVFYISGCSNSSNDNNKEPYKIIPQSLGIYIKDNPEQLKNSLYLISASQTTYLYFDLSEDSVIGYVNSEGTCEIYNTNGDALHSDIFFPEGGGLKTLGLDSGKYTMKIQNSINEDSYFAFFTDNMNIDLTLIKDDAEIPVHAGVKEFIKIEASENSDFKASLKGGKVSLYDMNFNLLEKASQSFNHTLKKGEYILFADNGVLSTSSDLKILF